MEVTFSRTKKIIVSAMFLALAIIIGRFRIVVPGMFRIVFNGPFYKFIAIIFGPLYGAAISFLTETIGVLLNSVGNYIWLFSVVAALKGFLVGLLWRVVYKKNDAKKKVLPALLFSIAIPDLLASALNSLVMKFYFLWPMETFFSMLAIRLFKESVIVIINLFGLNVMIDVYQKIITKGEGK